MMRGRTGDQSCCSGRAVVARRVPVYPAPVYAGSASPGGVLVVSAAHLALAGQVRTTGAMVEMLPG